MAPVRESGTAIAAAGGALWAAAATCGPLPFPFPVPFPLLPAGVEVEAESGVRLAAALGGGESTPFGSAGTGAAAAAGFESVAPLDLVVPVEDDGEEDIGAWSGRG